MQRIRDKINKIKPIIADYIKAKKVTVTLAKFIAEGESTWYWYYGYSYRIWDQNVTVFYPIPINYLVRAVRWISHKWDRFRGRPSWFDREIQKAESRAYLDAYQGVTRDYEALLERAKRKLAEEVATK